jgi:hypothetical protein
MRPLILQQVQDSGRILARGPRGLAILADSGQTVIYLALTAFGYHPKLMVLNRNPGEGISLQLGTTDGLSQGYLYRANLSTPARYHVSNWTVTPFGLWTAGNCLL